LIIALIFIIAAMVVLTIVLATALSLGLEAAVNSDKSDSVPCLVDGFAQGEPVRVVVQRLHERLDSIHGDVIGLNDLIRDVDRVERGLLTTSEAKIKMGLKARDDAESVRVARELNGKLALEIQRTRKLEKDLSG